MWAIRVLSGPQAGKIFPLKFGTNTLGRAPSCDIKILSPGVSKEHVKIDVLQDKLIIQDMGSRNGTFVNGTQYRSVKVKAGDRIGLHDVVLEIIPYSPAPVNSLVNHMPPPPTGNTGLHAMPGMNGNLAYQQPMPQMPPMSQMPPPQMAPAPQASAQSFVEEYVERVVLPGVYRLAELMEFRWLLAFFMSTFILLVTSLSTIPLIRILRDSVEQQSQQHALTIAASLARVNEGPIREGIHTAINMSTAQRSGVLDAMIISRVDGKIIAPASKAESYADLPFVHEARNWDKESVKQIDNNTVVAMYPINAYNPETGANGTIAYAVVKYDMTTLAVDDSKTISLFVITLAIAGVLGAILFFFLYKLIEYPINSLNSQLSNALREGRDDLKVSFIFEPLTKLTSNINSALTRAISGGDAGPINSIEHDRRLEMTNIIEMVGFAGMVVNAVDRTIVSMNQAFEQKTRMSPAQIINSRVDDLSDQALRLNLLDLLARLESNPDQLATSELDFGGQNNQIIAQAIFGTSKIAYFLVILVPAGGEG